MNEDLYRLAAHLHEPAPPPTLMATVMARVAQEADARASTATRPRTSPLEDGALVTALGTGLVAVVGVTMWAWLASGGVLSQMAPRLRGEPVGLIAVADPAALPFVLGLVLYLYVLFQPLQTRRRA